MDAFAKGFGIGVGFILGVVMILVVCFLLFLLFWEVYKLAMKRKFSVDLFHQYSQDLLSKERFEELEDIKYIISLLEKKEAPKEMLKKYEVNIKSDLEWIPTPDGGERLILVRDRRIVRRNKK